MLSLGPRGRPPRRGNVGYRLLSVRLYRPSRGTSRGTTTVSAACNLRTASTPAALSGQAERLGRWAVLMVRRRSTVRFRKGAPGQRIDSKRIEQLVGPKVEPTGLQPGAVPAHLHPMGVMKPPAVPPELVPVPSVAIWGSCWKGTRPGLHQRPGRGDDPVLASSGARLVETAG
jgi:hypothetical protein